MRRRVGFTMLETVIGISILTFLLLALFSLITSNLATLFTSNARATGLALAQEKLEDLKNLPYDSLSTTHGTIYPAGTIPDDENLSRNNLRYRVHTDIHYVDNDYDGNAQGTVSGKPIDTYPYDYKKATIQIYDQKSGRKYSELSTDIAAKAAETAGNTGVLIVKVINAAGDPVDGASVAITNSTVSPSVDIQTTSDTLGQVIIPKLPPDTGKDYHVIVSKGGYSAERTYATDATTPTPTNPDFGMVAQQTVVKTFAIDSLANLTLTLKDQSGNPLSGRSIAIHGAKQVNSSPVSYKYNQTSTTDAAGQIQLNLIEWDSYSFGVAGMTILAASPYQPVTVAPSSFASVALTGTILGGYPAISAVTPNTTPPTSSLEIDITGAGFTAGSTVRLRQAGQTDRLLGGITYAAPNLLSGTVDLSGATGSWDILVTTGANTTTQTNGMTIQ